MGVIVVEGMGARSTCFTPLRRARQAKTIIQAKSSPTSVQVINICVVSFIDAMAVVASTNPSPSPGCFVGKTAANLVIVIADIYERAEHG